MSTPADNTSPAPTPVPRRRRLLFIVGVVVAVVAVVLGPHFWAENRHAAAERALERRDFDAARAELEQCRAIRSEDTDDTLLAIRIERRAGELAVADNLIRAHLSKYPSTAAIDRESLLLRTQQGAFPDVDAGLARCLARGDGADPGELEAALAGAMNFLIPASMRGEAKPDGPAADLVKKARSCADLWLRLRPAPADQVEGLVWRGVFRAITADPGAPADLRAALALDPDHRGARFHLAITIRPDAPAEATSHLELLARRYPSDTPIKGVLGTLYRGAGRFEDARKLFDEVLAAEPKNVPMMLERGGLELDQGRADRAEPWFSTAHKTAPHDPRTSFALANCLRALGREAEAKALLDQYQNLSKTPPKP